jgi:hypothetical protein
MMDGVVSAVRCHGHHRGVAGRVGGAGLSKLVRVQVRELASSNESAGIAIRWEATGTGGAQFPVLDADVRLAPAGDRVTVLTMAGSYRPSFGILGAGRRLGQTDPDRGRHYSQFPGPGRGAGATTSTQ